MAAPAFEHRTVRWAFFSLGLAQVRHGAHSPISRFELRLTADTCACYDFRWATDMWLCRAAAQALPNQKGSLQTAVSKGTAGGLRPYRQDLWAGFASDTALAFHVQWRSFRVASPSPNPTPARRCLDIRSHLGAHALPDPLLNRLNLAPSVICY